MNALDKAKLIAKTIDSKKAKSIDVLDVSEQTSLCDFFVIASCTSTTQVKACADWSEEVMKNEGYSVHHTEGYAGGNWILLDFGDVVVHVMTDETRNFYDMERLWEDAKPVQMDFDE